MYMACMKSAHKHMVVNTVLLSDSKFWITSSECSDPERSEVWRLLKDKLKMVCATGEAGSGSCSKWTEQSRCNLLTVSIMQFVVLSLRVYFKKNNI